jgi:hypothetical protein
MYISDNEPEDEVLDSDWKSKVIDVNKNPLSTKK